MQRFVRSPIVAIGIGIFLMGALGVSVMRKSGGWWMAQVTPECRIDAGSWHSDLAFSNDGSTLYAGSFPSGAISVISTATHERIKTMTVGTGTHDIAMMPGATKAYVAYDNHVAVVDTVSNTAIRFLFVGFGAQKVLFTPDGSKAYVLLRDDSRVAVIDTASYTITHVSIDENPLSFHKRIGMVMTPDGAKVFVLSTHDRPIAVIATQSDTVTARIPVNADYPADLVMTPDGTKAYVLNKDSGSMVVLDTARDAVMTSIEVDPGIVIFSPDSSKAYVSQTSAAYNEVKVINTATHAVTASISLPYIPSAMAVTANGAKLYVAADPGIHIINTSTHDITKTIETVFGGPLAITPDGTNMYVGSLESSNGMVVVATQTDTLLTRCGTASSSSALSPVSVSSSSSSLSSAAVSSFATRCGDSRISGSEICERCPNYPTASVPVQVVTGDFNGDGRQDLAAGGTAANVRDIPSMTVYLGAGNGTFHSRMDSALPAGTQLNMVVGDFNGDAKDDIAIPRGVLLGQGNGAFTYQAAADDGFYFPAIAEDMNADGYDDALTVSPSSTTVFLGGPSGALTTGASFSTGETNDPKRGQIGGISVLDIDRDGKKDIVFNVVAYDANASYLRLLFGRGNGTFDAPVDVDTGVNGNGADVFASDFNGDSKPDVMIAYQSMLTVFVNQGNRVFVRQPLQVVGFGSQPGSQVRAHFLADMNADGKKDIVWSSGVPVLGNTVYAGVFVGNGDATFALDPARTITFPYEIDRGLAVGLFNADQLPDIAAPHWPVSSPTSGHRSFTVAINGGQNPSALCAACPSGQICNEANCQQCMTAPVSSSSSSPLASSAHSSSSRSSVTPSSAASVAASSAQSMASSIGSIVAQCGNAMLQGSEQCDAGIPCAAGFICSNCTCLPQSSSSQTAVVPSGSSSSAHVVMLNCGDGVLDSLEQCERGIDHCPDDFICEYSSCLCMPAFLLSSSSAQSSVASTLVASESFCGNGVREGTEQCDTGIPCSGNGFCTADCMCQILEMPSPDEPSALSRCGDGILGAGEQCDSGIPCANNGFCTAACICQELKGTAALCGNGVLNAREECDDANTKNGDGCSAHCNREVTEPTVQCGNNRIEGDEQCERTIPCPGTNYLCRNCQCFATAVPVCGNGTLESDEACETTVPCTDPTFLCASCRCIPPVCGDGSRTPGEECDDGNTRSGDGCSASCTREIPTVVASEQLCGNGIVELSEECDDGNQTNFDGCSASCSREAPALESLDLSLVTEDHPVTVTVTAPSAPVLLPTSVTGPTPKKSLPSDTPVPIPPPRPATSSAPVSVTFPVAATVTQQLPVLHPTYGQPSAAVPAFAEASVGQPYASVSGPAGKTGPASLALMVSGAAAGFAWMRRKRGR